MDPPELDGKNARSSPSGSAELFSLTSEIESTPVMALVRNGDFSKPVLFDGVLHGYFIGEHELILQKNGREIVFARDDGSLGPHFEKSWHVHVQMGGDRVLLWAEGLLFLDRRGKLLARAPLPDVSVAPSIEFVSGGVLVEHVLNETKFLTLLAPDGREIWKTSGIHSRVISGDGRVFAVQWGDGRKRIFKVYSASSGALLGEMANQIITPEPQLVFTPQGDRLIVGDGPYLRVLNLKKNSTQTLSGYPSSRGSVLEKILPTSKEEACLWLVKPPTVGVSCAADYIVDLRFGTHRRPGKDEACIEKNGFAARVKLPALASGHMPSEGCGLDVSDNLERAVHLEGAKETDGTDMKAAVYEVSSGKLVSSIPLPDKSPWLPFSILRLNMDGSRLLAWNAGELCLIDVPNSKVLTRMAPAGIPVFLEKNTKIIDLSTRRTISDWDGNPSKTWPADGVWATAMPARPPDPAP